MQTLKASHSCIFHLCKPRPRGDTAEFSCQPKAQLQREKEQDQMKLHAKLEKLDVLEKECFRLTTTQQTAEKTKCLKRDPPQRMDPKSRALPLERDTTLRPCGLHYLQKPVVLSEPQSLYKPLRTTSQGKAGPPNSGEPVSMCDSLSELLMAMQEELDQMTVEHRDLLKQMMQTGSHSVPDDVEQELEQLVKKMESKGEQISKLRKHQDRVCKLQQKIQNSRIKESSGVLLEGSGYKGAKDMKNIPVKCLNETNPFQRNSSFRPMRVHNLPGRLRRDDIKWEQ